MSTGVTGTTGSLIVRKAERGVTVEGTPPQTHTFPRKFIDRELNKAVRIHVVIPANPPVTYEVSAIDGSDLVGHLIPTVAEPPVPQRKRRFFRRSN